ncbi:MAG: ATPase domain-containing protein [Candidatus Diapherotrites archaeon]
MSNEKEIKQERKYFKTHIPGMDEMFTRGIPWGSAVIVEGGPGSGKTLFCLQSGLNACKDGYKVLYMSFEEKEESLRDHMKMFGYNPEEYERKGLLKIKRFNALDIARSVEALLSEAKKELLIDVEVVLIPKDFKPDIVLIDSLTSISSAFSGEEYRFRIYMEQMFRYLETHNITSLLIRETPKPTHTGTDGPTEGGEAISFLSDGIIVIYNVLYSNGTRGRALEIFKLRGENFQRKLVELTISDKEGIRVYPDRPIKGKYTLT